MMRKISLIILHCTATDSPELDSVQAIRKIHIEQRGFKDIGYQYLIRKSGLIEKGRPEKIAGAHCEGYNQHSIGVALSGLDKFTKFQFESLKILLLDLMKKYNLESKDIVGHELLDKKGKTCPNFNWREFVATL
jgi:N-acetyl-anhydromuramyl-L-alanine amidase AmpD